MTEHLSVLLYLGQGSSVKVCKFLWFMLKSFKIVRLMAKIWRIDRPTFYDTAVVTVVTLIWILCTTAEGLTRSKAGQNEDWPYIPIVQLKTGKVIFALVQCFRNGFFPRHFSGFHWFLSLRIYMRSVACTRKALSSQVLPLLLKSWVSYWPARMKFQCSFPSQRSVFSFKSTNIHQVLCHLAASADPCQLDKSHGPTVASFDAQVATRSRPEQTFKLPQISSPCIQSKDKSSSQSIGTC